MLDCPDTEKAKIIISRETLTGIRITCKVFLPNLLYSFIEFSLLLQYILS